MPCLPLRPSFTCSISDSAQPVLRTLFLNCYGLDDDAGFNDSREIVSGWPPSEGIRHRCSPNLATDAEEPYPRNGCRTLVLLLAFAFPRNDLCRRGSGLSSTAASVRSTYVWS